MTGEGYRFGETVAPGFQFVFSGEPLHSGRSEFQKIDVYSTEHFGRVLTLDDTIQTTEWDEFCYHEMLVHPALSSLPNLERVLIIGGGDGGTLRHVLMHDPREAINCEIDGEVVRVCREFMPSLAAGAFDDPRATSVIGDGAAFVADHVGAFDAVIVDSTDPVGAAEILFSNGFYTACLRALRPGGVFVSQTGSPMYQARELHNTLDGMREVFGVVEPYLGSVPTYPGVLWSYTVGTAAHSVASTPAEQIASHLSSRNIRPKLYTPQSHAAAFALPPFVTESIAAGAPTSVSVL